MVNTFAAEPGFVDWENSNSTLSFCSCNKFHSASFFLIVVMTAHFFLLFAVFIELKQDFLVNQMSYFSDVVSFASLVSVLIYLGVFHS